MKTMKNKIKLTVLLGLLYLFIFFLSFLFFFSIANLLYNFQIIIADLIGYIVLIASAVVSTLVFWVLIKISKRQKISKLKNNISEIFPAFLLFLLIICLIFVSIQSEISWSKEELKDLVSLQWTIFSLSITVYIVWEVLFSRILKDTKPKRKIEEGVLSDLQYIQEKKVYRENIAQKFFVLIFLVLNIFVLLLATTVAYFPTYEVSVFGQALVVSSFYICTNTFIQMLLDIIMPIFSAKKEAFKDVQVTDADISKFNKTTELLLKLSEALEKIDKIPELDDIKRKELKDNLISELLKLVQPEISKKNVTVEEKDDKGKDK